MLNSIRINWGAYFRLSRIDKPVGIILLWLPTAWALWLVNNNHPPMRLVMLFFVGTCLMRTAGCVVNDIADRNFDLHVKRTCMRPVTSGELSVYQALIFLIVLLLGALWILLQLPESCFYYAVAALLITIIYPFCKRYFQAPQFVLGIAFSMGIPIVYAASAIPLDIIALCLVCINLLWTLAYDTEYAMVDKPYDLKIGVKSTAILFAHNDRLIIALLQTTAHVLWLFLAKLTSLSTFFFLAWFGAALNLLYQHYLIAEREAEGCFKAFKINCYYGSILWLGLILSKY